jgi:hypothetical protein
VLTPYQVTWFRAGHAHAGVLLLMSLLPRRQYQDISDNIAALADSRYRQARFGNNQETTDSVKPEEVALSDCLMGSWVVRRLQ